MKRLSGLDASFLYLESGAQHMHIMAAIELDVRDLPHGYDFRRFRDRLAERIGVPGSDSGIPTLRRKIADSVLNFDHPVWVDDMDFDLNRHVRRGALPQPAGINELAECMAQLDERQLDRSRPLWEMWLIEGLHNGNVVAVLRIHHAATDGVGGIEILAQLCSLEAGGPPMLADAERASGSLQRVRLALGGALGVAKRPLRLAELLPETALIPWRWIHHDEAMPAPFSAPRTIFNTALSAQRTVSLAQISLDDVKRIKEHFGVTINDVVLSICAGALRAELQALDALPERDLVAMVPVSIPAEAEQGRVYTEGTNKVTGMFTRLDTTSSDAVTRLHHMHAQTDSAKRHFGTLDLNLVRRWAELLPPLASPTFGKLVTAAATRNLHRPVFNLIVSNVPGPQVPMYLLGARVAAIYPLGPVFHGAGINISVLSVDGNLNVGIVAAEGVRPTPDALTHALADQIKELMAALP